jgi:hypothetical protein
MIIAVGGQDFPSEVVRPMTKALHVLQGSRQHGRDVAMILAIPAGLPMNNNLVFGIYQGLAILSLDSAVRGHHLSRVIVGKVTLIFFALSAPLGLVFCEPLLDLICLLL